MAQSQCRCLRQDRCQLIFRRTTWSDSKDSECRNCNSTSSLLHYHSWCGKQDSKHSLKWLWFSVESYVMDQRRGDGWFFGWAKILAIGCWKEFSRLWVARREDCLCSERDHPEFPLQEDSQPRGAESPKRGPVSARETNRLHDLWLLSSDWCSWRSIGLCRFILWWQKIPSNEILESLCKLRIREKNVSELYDMEIHQKTSVPNYQKLKIMVKRCIGQKLRLQNFDARHGRIESGAVVKSRKGIIGVEGGKGICYQWKEESQCSKEDQCSFRHETHDRALKPEHTAATPSEPAPSRGWSVSRKRSIRDKSNLGSILRQPRRYHLKGTSTWSRSEYWHPPECQLYKTETVCKAGDTSVCSRITRLKNNQVKSRKRAFDPQNGKSDDKSAVAICVSQDSEPSELPKSVKYRGNPRQKVLGSIRRVRFTQSMLRQ